MPSSRTAQSKQRLVGIVLFVCVAFTALMATYLFASYSRFLQGHKLGVEFGLGEPNRLSTTTPTYAFIAEYYFHILISMFIAAIICWFRLNIVSGLLNLVLISYSIYQAWQIHRMKSGIYLFENYDFPYFDIVRETAVFDMAGAVFLISSLLLHIYVILLIKNEWNLRPGGAVR